MTLKFGTGWINYGLYWVEGKLPANQANPEVMSAFRREEREKTISLLENYLRVCLATKVFMCMCIYIQCNCWKLEADWFAVCETKLWLIISIQLISLKVKVSILIVQEDQVQKGILDLVVKHGIRKLVIRAAPGKWVIYRSLTCPQIQLTWLI